MQEFQKLFNFRPAGSMLVGVERESLLIKGLSGQIVPIAQEVLGSLNNNGRFGYELSACQLEDRVGPCHLNDLETLLIRNENEILVAEKALGFWRSFIPVGPDDMPLDVFPDPEGRYHSLAEKMTRQVLKAACQVIGTHIHIGMPDHQTALLVYNQIIDDFDELCQLGNTSNGKRLEKYRIVAPDCIPPKYKNWWEFQQEAAEKGFITDPRSCWHLIRISVHGTIEFRMFDATNDLDKIVGWAAKCHQLCQQALIELF